jgi:hypothetical protein
MSGTHHSVNTETHSSGQEPVPATLKPSTRSTNSNVSTSEDVEVMLVGKIVDLPPFGTSLRKLNVFWYAVDWQNLSLLELWPLWRLYHGTLLAGRIH